MMRIYTNLKKTYMFRRWQPNISEAAPKKQHHHRAAYDIKESLNELRYYKKNLFVS